jgi:hypothetical protein
LKTLLELGEMIGDLIGSGKTLRATSQSAARCNSDRNLSSLTERRALS